MERDFSRVKPNRMRSAMVIMEYIRLKAEEIHTKNGNNNCSSNETQEQYLAKSTRAETKNMFEGSYKQYAMIFDLCFECLLYAYSDD